MEEPYSRLIASKAHSAGHITRVADEPSPCPTGRLEVSEAVGWVTRKEKEEKMTLECWWEVTGSINTT